VALPPETRRAFLEFCGRKRRARLAHQLIEVKKVRLWHQELLRDFNAAQGTCVPADFRTLCELVGLTRGKWLLRRTLHFAAIAAVTPIILTFMLGEAIWSGWRGLRPGGFWARIASLVFPLSKIRVRAHSIAEEALFTKLLSCPSCGMGPMRLTMHEFPCTSYVQCASCGKELRLVSDESLVMNPHYTEALESDDCVRILWAQRRISHVQEPSRIIDVAQWLDRCRVCEEAISRHDESSSEEKREKLLAEYELVQSAREALKFYSDGGEYPPKSAFFSKRSRAALAGARDRFSRSRIEALLAQYRSLEELEAELEPLIAEG
jgi:hypothetical protein